MTPEQNFRLTRVEGDAPMGAMMRENFWIPFALDSQLEAGGAPRRIRLLGKDYAAFRADDGRIAAGIASLGRRRRMGRGKSWGWRLMCQFLKKTGWHPKPP